MAEQTYASLGESYETANLVAGAHERDFQRSLLLYIVADVTQGLIYLGLVGVMLSLFAQPIDVSAAWVWLGVLAPLAIVSATTRWFAHDFEQTAITAHVTHAIRVKLGHKLRTMPLQVLGKFRTGDLNSSLSSNVELAVGMLTIIAGVFLEAALTPVVVLVGLFFIDWRMAVVMLVLLPLAVPLYHRRRSAGVKGRSELAAANAKLESDIIEYVQGLPVLRATNQTGKDAARLQAGIAEVRDLQRDGQWATSLNLMLGSMLVVGILIALAVAGSFWVGEGTLSVATLAAILFIVSRLLEPMSLFLALTQAMDILDSSFTRVRSILDTDALEVLQPEDVPAGHDIEFDDVSFTYAEQRETALHKLSCRIPKRAMTAIVGPSGSGKTTMTKLMMRYADLDAGTIRVGGVDVRQMSQEALMGNFSVVFQDVYLFDESILDNIRMAKANATDAEVKAAAKAAHCHDFVERLPEGYATRVGDIGSTLSGGERQRISIARAILKDAPVVILDEPTAALDSASEVAVQRAIDSLVKDKTIIVIAHRLSTIAGADQILVVDEGRVTESGTHAELLDRGGKYHDMWKAQQRSKAWKLGQDRKEPGAPVAVAGAG